MSTFYEVDTLNNAKNGLESSKNYVNRNIKDAINDIHTALSGVPEKVGRIPSTLNFETPNKNAISINEAINSIDQSIAKFNQENNAAINQSLSMNTGTSIGALTGISSSPIVSNNNSETKKASSNVKNMDNVKNVQNITSDGKMTDEIDKEFNNIKFGDSSQSEEFFKNNKFNISDKFGVNPSEIANMDINSEEYKILIDNLKEKYGFDEEAAKAFIANYDKSNITAYSSLSDQIFDSYKNNPEQFEKDFGFSMYNKSGALNSAALMTNMFITNNDKLFVKDKDGKVTIDPESVKKGNNVFENQKTLIKDEKFDDETINKYLKEKNEDSNYSSKTLLGKENSKEFYKDGTNEYDTNKIKQAVTDELENNNKVTLSIRNSETDANNDIRLIPNDKIAQTQNTTETLNTTQTQNKAETLNTTQTQNKAETLNNNAKTYDVHTWYDNVANSDNCTYVTGVDEKGLTTSTFGKSFTVPWEDLKGNNFSIISSTLKVGK